MKKLINKYLFNGLVHVKTGLHIGGNSESVEIGGIDNPVIKVATKRNEPYIPASSLKGKIRSLLESLEGKGMGSSGDVNKLFGWHKDEGRETARVIFRDSYLARREDNRLVSDELQHAIDEGYLDMPYTESKWENTIDRKSAVANPRQMERVPAQSIFYLEFIVNEFEGDSLEENLNILKKGIKLLENDYLGGSGTRGYGQVEIEIDWDHYSSVFTNS